MSIVAIAAVGRNRAIGRDGDIPWRIPEDWQRFKRLTSGCTLIMGRSTFESIGRPLPGRASVVVSRDPDAEAKWRASEAGSADLPEGTSLRFVTNLDEALAAADPARTVWIGGGAQVYRQVWDRLDELDICEVDQAPEADTFFPAIEPGDWAEVSREPRNGYAFVRYRRKGRDAG